MILGMTNLNPKEVSNPNPATTTGATLKIPVEVAWTPSQVVDTEVRVTPKDMEAVEVEPMVEEINMAVKLKAGAALLVVTPKGVAVLEVEANLMTMVAILHTTETRKVMEAVVTPNLGITVTEAVDTELRTRDANPTNTKAQAAVS